MISKSQEFIKADFDDDFTIWSSHSVCVANVEFMFKYRLFANPYLLSCPTYFPIPSLTFINCMRHASGLRKESGLHG